MKSKLSEPAVKTFIINLFERKEGLVWLQGEITEVNLDIKGSISVNDGTGVVEIIDVKSNPSGIAWMQKGIYCMVIGQIVALNRKVRAVKVTNLSAQPLHKQIWAKEIIHLQNRLQNK